MLSHLNIVFKSEIGDLTMVGVWNENAEWRSCFLS